MRVLVAGCGWFGEALGRALVARGDRVTGVRRRETDALGALGIEPLAMDLSDPSSADRIPAGIEAIVACQSAAGEGEESYRKAYLEANRTLLTAARRLRLSALVYTSSTGVFGQPDGSDVDESTPPAPADRTGEILAEAERLLLDAAGEGLPARVVRLSGLYGPGRTGVVDRVRRGTMALGPGDDAWTNWCHLDDAVAFVRAALDRGRNGVAYHATDTCPMRRREVVRWIAARIGIAAPGRAERSVPQGAANRRILGDRTRAELGVRLAYPSLREGLGPLLAVR